MPIACFQRRNNFGGLLEVGGTQAFEARAGPFETSITFICRHPLETNATLPVTRAMSDELIRSRFPGTRRPMS